MQCVDADGDRGAFGLVAVSVGSVSAFYFGVPVDRKDRPTIFNRLSDLTLLLAG